MKIKTLCAALALAVLTAPAQAVTVDATLDSTARPNLGTSDLTLTLTIDGSPLNWDYFVIH